MFHCWIYFCLVNVSKGNFQTLLSQTPLTRNWFPYVIKLKALIAVVGICSSFSSGQLALLKRINWGCQCFVNSHQVKHSYADLPLIRLPLNTCKYIGEMLVKHVFSMKVLTLNLLICQTVWTCQTARMARLLLLIFNRNLGRWTVFLRTPIIVVIIL